MEKITSHRVETTDLRCRAEKRLQEAKVERRLRLTDETQRLLHELEVHQTELDMQNGELLLTQEHLEGLVRERTLSLEGEIAERRRAELEIKELNANLEQLLAERTSQLHSTLGDLRTFSASISHDLRTSLRSINTFVNLLIEDFGGALNEEGKKLIDTIDKRTLVMGELIDDLLLFSRNSMQPLTVEPIDMTGLTKELVGVLSGEAPDGNIEFRMAELPRAKGDRSMVAQVLENLLSNAAKFSKRAEKPVIAVGSLANEEENVFFVKDNGIGFDMKYIDKIFDVFERLHKPEDFEGTGVGLAIVKQIVTKHNGRVWAESKPGEGATFYFSLPKP